MSLSHVCKTKAGCPTEHDNRWRLQRNMEFCSRPDGSMAFYDPLHSITLVEHLTTFYPLVSRCGLDCDHSLYTWRWPALEERPAPLSSMSCTFNQFTHTSNATISHLSYCPTLSSQSHDDKQPRPLHRPSDTSIKFLKSGWKSPWCLVTVQEEIRSQES